MQIIIGLGNPGSKYDKTRHNMGFDVIDRIASSYNLNFKEKSNYLYAKQKIQGKDCLLVKPLTYMNLSGEALRDVKKYYKVNDNDIIVIYDDKDTLPGNIRIRKSGSSGGHNGIKSILNYSTDFIRVRVGIGRPKFSDDMINHVIAKVHSSEEIETLNLGIKKAEKAIYDIIKYGVDKAMNKHNINPNKENKEKEENKENKQKEEKIKDKKENKEI